MDRQARAARAIEEFLSALGYTIEGELVGTGARVAQAWIDEFTSGEGQDAGGPLREGSLDLGPGAHGPVLLRDVAVATMCPHHLLPSHGRATVGYLPKQRAAGLGAIAQAIRLCAQRLTLQETLSQSIATTLHEALDAKGSFCHLALVHTCFATRGERESGAVVETLAFSGTFAAEDRPLALALLGGGEARS